MRATVLVGELVEDSGSESRGKLMFGQSLKKLMILAASITCCSTGLIACGPGVASRDASGRLPVTPASTARPLIPDNVLRASPTSNPLPSAPPITPLTRPTVPSAPAPQAEPQASTPSTPAVPAPKVDARERHDRSPTPAVGARSEKAPHDRQTAEPHHLEVAPAQHAQAIKDALVACENADAAACPAAVGMLVIRTAKTLGQCTAFLLNDHTLMTNSHCVPDEIKRAGADCSRNLEIFFPVSGELPAERATCDKVLTASAIDPEGSKNFVQKADYAVLSLRRTVQRSAVTLSREGLTEGLRLTAFTVDPLSKTAVRGLLRAKTCAAVYGTIVVPSFTQSFAPVGVFDGCGIIPGNSGSPAFDEQGHVRAVVHATMTPQNSNVISGNASKPQEFHGMGLMTNIACTDLPIDSASGGGTARDACVQRGTPQSLLANLAARSNPQELLPPFTLWQGQLTRTQPLAAKALVFRVDVPGNDGSGTLPEAMTQLLCVRPPNQWQAAGQAQPSVIHVRLPIWSFQPTLDASYRLTLEPTAVDGLDVSLTFDANALAQNGTAVGAVTAKSVSTGKTQSQPRFNFSQCR